MTIDARRPGLFLDRDGVINEDHGYVHHISDFVFRPGIFDLARSATKLGFAIVVITNQSGIGRGFFSEADYQRLTSWMRRRFIEEAAPLIDVLHAPHHPDAALPAYATDHPWRKPRPGMILEASRRHRLDLPLSVLLGDSDRDILAGHRAGVGCLLRLAEDADASGLGGVSFTDVRDLSEARIRLTAWAEEIAHQPPAHPE